MKIGIVVPHFTPYVRGNEYGLAQSLTDLGNEVTIITTTSRAPREKAITNKTSQLEKHDLDFNVEYLPVLLDIGDNPIARGTEKFIISQDVVMLQEDYPFVCLDAYNAAKKHNIPTILSSERTYYPENLARRYAVKLMDSTINKKLRNGVDVLTAHCSAAKEFMINELGVRRNIEVIHVGVDTELFMPLPSGGKYLTKGNFKILTVARLHRYKGLGYLIEAMKKIIEEVPDAHLYILGRGEEEQNLRNLTLKLSLEHAVTFLTGPIPNREIPSLYAECDIYVQPSIVEPFGIAVLEAMACAKPVVGTKAGGMIDTIKDMETGYLVAPKNPVELAERIVHIYANTGTRMGMAARDRAVELFDLKVIGTKYMELLHKMP
ncbi:Trehalose synthase [uncultured archaeon]|nr:Trehalose synthase [uncultured archaeon]